MAWFYLFLAIIFEVIGSAFLKLSEGYTKLMPTLGMAVSYALSFWLVSLVLKLKLDLGLVYAIWAGLGTALVAVVGVYYFDDTVTLGKTFSILLIIAGVVGLNMSGMKH